MFEQIQTGGLEALQKAMSDPVSFAASDYLLSLAAAQRTFRHMRCIPDTGHAFHLTPGGVVCGWLCCSQVGRLRSSAPRSNRSACDAPRDDKARVGHIGAGSCRNPLSGQGTATVMRLHPSFRIAGVPEQSRREAGRRGVGDRAADHGRGSGVGPVAGAAGDQQHSRCRQVRALCFHRTLPLHQPSP